MSPSKDPIQAVIVPQHVLVAGQVFHGEVELNFDALQEDEIQEVHVKLRGYCYTRVRNPAYQQQHQPMHEYENREILSENVTIWQKTAGVYPQPGSHDLRFPFSFHLPPNLPPSAHHEAYRGQGMVSYIVVAVGVREGTFHRNRRVAQKISVVPPDPSGAQVRGPLLEGWNGRWECVKAEDKIRRGIWGGYGTVQVQLSLPAIDVFPLFTAIPFTLQIITHTKEMDYDDTPSDPSDPIFPSPPTNPYDIEFILRSLTRVSTRRRSADVTDDEGKLGGMGVEDKSKAGGTSGVEVVVVPRVWVPKEGEGEKEKGEGKGCWRQESCMRSTIYFNCSPSFSTTGMSTEYHLHLSIDFPGIGNDTKLDFPLVIGSGLLTPEAQGGGYAPPMYGGMPLPQLGLPPAYWAHTDSDEKKE